MPWPPYLMLHGSDLSFLLVYNSLAQVPGLVVWFILVVLCGREEFRWLAY